MGSWALNRLFEGYVEIIWHILLNELNLYNKKITTIEKPLFTELLM